MLNLASVVKILRPGGKFIFTSANKADGALFGAFLRARHLSWEISAHTLASDWLDKEPGAEVGSAGRDAFLIVCTLRSDAHEVLRSTMDVLKEEVDMEVSRERYFHALAPWLPAVNSPHDAIRLLDVGGGTGELAAFFLQASKYRLQVMLMEENPQLAAEAELRFNNLEVLEKDGVPLANASVVRCGTCPWPLDTNSYDVVVLAFVLHHVEGGAAAR
eukprot:5972045-Amphidinium_carterae.1